MRSRSRVVLAHGLRRTTAVAVGVAALVLGIGAARPALASDDASWDAARRFDGFLDDHPWVARDLQRDPTLANDPRYLEEHRSLREFLEDHPGVRRELREDPYAVLRREHRVEREARRDREITRDQMRRFAEFMHDHPGVAHDLHADPTLVNSRSYLADHPSFREFLHEHAAIRQELQDNPYAFIRRWEHFAQRPEHRGEKAARPK